MPLLLVLLVAVIAILVSSKLRVSKGVNAVPLGCMSEQWLAEHRNSQPPS